MNSRDGEKLEEFIEKILSEKTPDYSDMGEEEELLKTAEVALLLKQDNFDIQEPFKERLFNELKGEVKKLSANKETISKKRKNFAFGTLSFVTVFSLLMMTFHPVGTVYAPMRLSKSVKPKEEIVEEQAYKFNNNKVVILLYNKKNNAILYWPFGQFAIFQ